MRWALHFQSLTSSSILISLNQTTLVVPILKKIKGLSIPEIINIIPIGDLESHLMAKVPENLSKSMMATWEKKISDILHSYKHYISYVCGHSAELKKLWVNHEVKWDAFSKRVLGGNKSYCVHY